MSVKIKYEVSPVPTGAYRSFQKRGWPSGFINNKIACTFTCNDEYIPANLKNGNHSEIRAFVYDHNPIEHGINCQRYKLKGVFLTLVEAKQAVKNFYESDQGRSFFKK